MEEIGVDFSDPNLPEIKNVLLVGDPARTIVDENLLKTVKEYMPKRNLKSEVEAPALQQPVWGSLQEPIWGAEEDTVREDTKEDIRDNREEDNLRSFIKTETSE